MKGAFKSAVESSKNFKIENFQKEMEVMTKWKVNVVVLKSLMTWLFM